ncbi:MAG: imidazolonepropionase [Micavibrio sp.]|nr:MAG: imidazolonepropionase [Micavibrio sp.]
MSDAIRINARIATMAEEDGYGIIENGALQVRDGKIAWIGTMDDLPDAPEKLGGKVIDMQQRWITPALIDCHTHLVYGGNRSGEFEMRLNGATYEEIARAGGGILSTVTATNAASEETLYQSALKRLQALAAEGATTVEIKSGYGLSTKGEAKMLRVATRLRDETGLRILRTFLGAHALPPEYKEDKDGYIDLVCNDMLPEIAAENLADAVDAFGEKIAFTPQQVARVFDTAQKLGLPVKLHADQLSDQGGGGLAADYAALSADHIEYTNEESIRKMAAAGTVAVLLPGAFYFLKETKKPPVDLLRKHGVRIALATDCNPGSSPVTSPLLMMNMGCTFFGLTPAEALAGMTRNAAKALGIEKECGTLEKGKSADFAVWDIDRPAELSYHIGFNPLQEAVHCGKTLPLQNG